MNVSKELKTALQRVSAPPGFSDRAVARTKLAGWRSFSPRIVRRVVAIVALVTLGGLAAHRYMEEQRIRDGEKARAQLMLALQITAEKTDLARRAIQE